MPQQIAGRSYLLRSRAVPSKGSSDATSTAAHSPTAVAQPLSLPVAQPRADRQNHAKREAGWKSKVAVASGEACRADSSSTGSPVRVGVVELHSGQPLLQASRIIVREPPPSSRSVSERPQPTVSLAPQTTLSTPSSWPPGVRRAAGDVHASEDVRVGPQS